MLSTQHPSTHGLYISAGVHGDEPAPVAALIDWAEDNIALLLQAHATILPLFNPHGLSLNTRTDEVGTDLNRNFHDPSHPHIGPWKQSMNGRTFSVGLMLHEDYDAQGMYAYELSGTSGIRAETFLKASDAFIPRDHRPKIDGHISKQGVIAKRNIPRHLPGLPEAIVVYREHAPATLTFESPSEYSLESRVRAHKAIIDKAFREFAI